MAVDPIIKQKAEDIRHKIYGKEVRESLASGLEAMSLDVVENKGRQSVVEDRQDSVESQWQAVSDEMTDRDVISAPEVIAARNGESNLKARLDKEHNEVNAQLAQMEQQNKEEFNSVRLVLNNAQNKFENKVDLDLTAYLIELNAVKSIINTNFANSISDGIATGLAE